MNDILLDIPDKPRKKYAPFGLRILAAAIDGGLIIGVTYVMHEIIVRWLMSLGLIPEVASEITVLITIWLYDAGFHASRFGATPGKMISRIHVVDKDGHRLSFWKATLRYVSKLATIPIGLIGILLILLQKERQGLHDRLAGSWVVYKEV
tara:strand:- start:17962 stop:18411 length:450 start_codon:yes stop_codon:yes gene_type:complete